jgi:hypothetical protein
LKSALEEFSHFICIMDVGRWMWRGELNSAIRVLFFCYLGIAAEKAFNIGCIVSRFNFKAA